MTEQATGATRVSESLADYTTLRVGGPARRLIVVTTEAELIDRRP